MIFLRAVRATALCMKLGVEKTRGNREDLPPSKFVELGRLCLPWRYQVSVQAKAWCAGPKTCCRASQASPVNDGLQLQIIAGMLGQPQRHQQHSSCCGVQIVTAGS